MLTTNINIEDQLIKGEMGTVKHIKIKENKVGAMVFGIR